MTTKGNSSKGGKGIRYYPRLTVRVPVETMNRLERAREQTVFSLSQIVLDCVLQHLPMFEARHGVKAWKESEP